MNKRIKKKKQKQMQIRNLKELIRLSTTDPDWLKKVVENAVETIYKNIEKFIEELKEFAEKMKTEFFVGEEVIADGRDTEITAIAYDECGEKVYMVEGSMKDYHFNELRRIHKC